MKRMSTYFKSSFLKIQRANKHIKDIEKSWERFSKTQMKHFSTVQGMRGEGIEQISPIDPVPDEFSLMIGDAVHNLRTALDHCVWSIFKIHNPTKRHGFPVYSNVKDFKNDKDKRIFGCPKYLLPIFKKLEPYKGGKGEIFWVLHEMDIGDKHHQMILVSKIEEVPYGLDETMFTSGRFQFYDHHGWILSEGRKMINLDREKPILKFNLVCPNLPGTEPTYINFKGRKIRALTENQGILEILNEMASEVENVIKIFEAKIRRVK